MKLEGKLKPFLIGGTIGIIFGSVLSGFLLYFGVILLFLFILVAVTENNISKKFMWWGFVAGASVSFFITLAFIWPVFEQ